MTMEEWNKIAGNTIVNHVAKKINKDESSIGAVNVIIVHIELVKIVL